jgi:hypothetical protein
MMKGYSGMRRQREFIRRHVYHDAEVRGEEYGSGRNFVLKIEKLSIREWRWSPWKDTRSAFARSDQNSKDATSETPGKPTVFLFGYKLKANFADRMNEADSSGKMYLRVCPKPLNHVRNLFGCSTIFLPSQSTDSMGRAKRAKILVEFDFPSSLPLKYSYSFVFILVAFMHVHLSQLIGGRASDDLRRSKWSDRISSDFFHEK